MSPDVIVHEAGTAKRLLSMPDHYSVELGDYLPMIVEGAPQVLELFNLRAKANANAEAARR